MFSAAAMTPKSETGAASFLTANPTFDGSNVRVAILDTGVDPGCGRLLSTTPSGAPKIIGLIDASGSGDVDTQARGVVETVGGVTTVRALSGRRLRVNPAWENPSNVWRVGAKHTSELMPRELARRVARDRAEADKRALSAPLTAALVSGDAGGDAAKGEAAKYTAVLAALPAALAAADAGGLLLDVLAFQDASGVWRVAVDVRGDGDLTGSRALASFALEREWATLDENSLVHFGVNVYADGDCVSIVTDAGAHGTHVAGIVAAFDPSPSASRDFDGVAPGAQIISVKIGDHRLGSMETGAALIRGIREAVDAGAHVINMSYGEASSRNSGRVLDVIRWAVLEKGVCFVASAGNSGPALSTVGAPGGLSPFAIGVGATATEAMMDDLYALRSFFAADAGRLPSTSAEGAMTGDDLTASALSPSGRASAPKTGRAHDRAEDVQYTWSSRGPSADGALGVCVSAPGGAITAVPSWTLAANQIMNGTSMSSPNIAGCIALLISGLLATNLPVCPFAIRRAIETTAKTFPGSSDALTVGHGMIDVPAAWAHLSFASSRGGVPTPFLQVTVPHGGAGAGGPNDAGVYLRDYAQTSVASDVSVAITPVFKEETSNAAKAAFSTRLAFETTAPGWVSVPSHLVLAAQSRSFLVHIDPRALSPGRVHYAEILGYEVQQTDDGALASIRSRSPLVRVPITVVKSEQPVRGVGSCTFTFLATPGEPQVVGAAPARLPLRPGKIIRRFIDIPQGAKWAEVLVSRLDSGGIDSAAASSLSVAGLSSAPTVGAEDSSLRTFVLHLGQVSRGTAACKTRDGNSYLRLAPGESDGAAVSLAAGGRCFEVCVAQFWSSLGSSEVSVDVRFFGLDASPVYIGSAAGISSVCVTPLLHDVALRPVGKLTKWVSTIDPTPGASAVTLPAFRALETRAPTYQIILEYKMTLAADAEVALSLSAFSDMLYESSFDGFLITVAAESGRTIAACDIFAEKVKLPKGTHTVRAFILAADAAKLNALSSTPLEVVRKLDSDVKLTLDGAHPLTGGGPVPSRLRMNQPLTLYVTMPPSGYPKASKAGDMLKGMLLLEDAQPRALLTSGRDYTPGEPLAGRSPLGLPVVVHLQSTPVSKEKDKVAADGEKGAGGGGKDSKDSDKSDERRMFDALHDAAIARLKTLSPFAPVKAGATTEVTSSAFGALATPTKNFFESTFEKLQADAISEHSVALHSVRIAAIDDALLGKCWSAPPPFKSALPVDAHEALETPVADLVRACAPERIALWFGSRHEDDSKAEKKDMADARTALIDGLWRRARSLCAATVAAVAAGGEAAASLPAPIMTPSGGTAASAAFSSTPAAPSPHPALPATASNQVFKAAVAALAQWSPTTGTEGPHAPLLTFEQALRDGLWSTAFDLVAKLDVHAQTRAHLKTYLLLRLGLPYFAARVATCATASFTKV